MEKWKQLLDDEGRSFVQFLRQNEEKIVCVACSKPIANKCDSSIIENAYSHTRSIEHGFNMFLMINSETEVIDLTNCDDHENWPIKPNKQTKVEIFRDADGSLKITGVNPIKYEIPIVDLPFTKIGIIESETPRSTALTSLDSYVTKAKSPSKRKQSEREADQYRDPSPKKRKTAQLTLERWIKNDERQQNIDYVVDPSLLDSAQDIPQQRVESVAQTSSSSSEGLTRINELRPAKRGISQIIRARVIIKSDIHPFHNFLGPTTMFTLDLIDESGEIRLSAFGANVNKLYDLVEVDRVYYFSNFKVKASNPSKTPVISKHNISCSNDTLIRPCVLTPLEIPKLEFNFQLISTVQEMKKDDVIDVLAIIEQFGDVQEKRLSNGSPGRCRGVWIVDQSKAKILLFVWGSNADNFQTNRPGDVIAVKRAKIKNYAKLNLDSSCLSSSTFKINPQLPEADVLRKWHQNDAKRFALKVLSTVPRPKKISAPVR